jgi:hypothetical protein
VATIQTIKKNVLVALILSLVVFVFQTLAGELIVDTLARFGITAKGLGIWILSHPLQTAIAVFLIVLTLSIINDLMRRNTPSSARDPYEVDGDRIVAGTVQDSPIVKADRGSTSAGRDIHITQNLVPEKSRSATKPILRIKDYGNEVKDLYGVNDFVVGYDTLFIDVFNKQKSGAAERVWSKIEWVNENAVVEVTHRGRWHIASATMKNETIKENLQYRNIDSNQAPQRLYFAWTSKDYHENCFYGLERDMDGRDSWGSPKYKLEAEEYTARITLLGNNGVKQQFKYRIRNNAGKMSNVEALTNESRKRN